MLRKIDCVMIQVDDVEAAAAYYAKVFGLHPQWSGNDSIGLAFPETNAEIVLHNDSDIPSSVEVHYLVDDVVDAVAHFAAQGCHVLVAPFDITIGKCAVIREPSRQSTMAPPKSHRGTRNLGQYVSGISDTCSRVSIVSSWWWVT
jgi:lactoylglutathione lyase